MIDDKDSANISDCLVPGVWAGHVCWPVNWIWLYSLLLNLKHKMESYILHGNRLSSSAFCWLTTRVTVIDTTDVHTFHSSAISLFCSAATPMLKPANQDSQGYQAVHNCGAFQVQTYLFPFSPQKYKVQPGMWHMLVIPIPERLRAGLP